MSNCLSTQRLYVPLPPSHSPCPTLSLPLLICLRFLRFGIQLKFSAWAALVTLGFIWKIRANPLPPPPSLLHALFVTFAIVIQITLRLRLHPFALIAHHLRLATKLRVQLFPQILQCVHNNFPVMILPGCCVAAGLGPRSSSMTSDTNESQKCNQHFYMDSYSIVRQGDSQIAQHLPQNGQHCTGMSRTRAAAEARSRVSVGQRRRVSMALAFIDTPPLAAICSRLNCRCSSCN